MNWKERRERQLKKQNRGEKRLAIYAFSYQRYKTDREERYR